MLESGRKVSKTSYNVRMKYMLVIVSCKTRNCSQIQRPTIDTKCCVLTSSNLTVRMFEIKILLEDLIRGRWS